MPAGFWNVQYAPVGPAFFRGAPPGDVDALVDVLLRLSQLAAEQPAIDTLEMNPVLVRPAGSGVAVLDVRGRLIG